MQIMIERGTSVKLSVCYSVILLQCATLEISLETKVAYLFGDERNFENMLKVKVTARYS
jgi:hypothetical protein